MEGVKIYAKNDATARKRGTFPHHEHENTKRFSGGVVFAYLRITWLGLGLWVWQQWNAQPAAIVLVLVSDRTIEFKQLSDHIYTNTNKEDARVNLNVAKNMIAKMKYHRRDKDVVEIEEKLL